MTPLLLVGGGKMGGALLAGWLDRGVAPGQITVVEPGAAAAEALRARHGVAVHADPDELIPAYRPATVVLAVKPQAMDDVVPRYARYAGPDACFLSIAAGTLKLYKKDTSYRGQAEFAGENPVDGVLIAYRLERASDDVLLRIARGDGTVIREMRVPGAAGTHRVNWDLRHPLPGRPDVWERFENDQLARPVESRGFFVSPGRYTVTLVAGGAESTRTVDVLGDPEMPITLAEYRARERFLLDAQALDQEARELMRAMGVSDGGGFRADPGEPDTPQARIRRVSRVIGGVQRDLNGGGVRPGTLYPPTQSMRDALAEARTELAALRTEMRR